MKTFQRQNPWTLQSMFDGTGRRRLTIARECPQPVLRRPVAPRRQGATKLAVTFAADESSAFAPGIRAVS
jgi:hypothetical protein